MWTGLLMQALVQVLHTLFPSRLSARPEMTPAVRLSLEISTRLAQTYYQAGRIADSIWVHLRSLNTAERHAPSPQLAEAVAAHGGVLSALPWFGRAVRSARRASAMVRSPPLADHVALRGWVHNTTSFVFMSASRHLDSLTEGNEGVAYATRAGDLVSLQIADVFCTRSLTHLGRLPEVVERSRRMCAGPMSPFIPAALMNWAEATGGDIPIGRLDEAMSSREVQRTPVWPIFGWQAQAIWLLRQRRNAEAIDALERALALGRGLRGE
ncbi:MAG TPA: hypothetical protein VE997_01945, partial [Candidatus Limnocylindria bacterium]|nr:hypothetical protein [Candidatus Limnocylindria bacterium]